MLAVVVQEVNYDPHCSTSTSLSPNFRKIIEWQLKCFYCSCFPSMAHLEPELQKSHNYLYPAPNGPRTLTHSVSQSVIHSGPVLGSSSSWVQYETQFNFRIPLNCPTTPHLMSLNINHPLEREEMCRHTYERILTIGSPFIRWLWLCGSQ